MSQGTKLENPEKVTDNTISESQSLAGIRPYAQSKFSLISLLHVLPFVVHKVELIEILFFSLIAITEDTPHWL